MPKLLASYETEEEIPEAHKELFEERQGKWILSKIEGITTDGDVHRVTTANTTLRKQNKELTETLKGFGDIKPEEIETLRHSVEDLTAQVEAGGKPDAEAIEKIVETRIKGKIGPLQRQLEDATKKLGEETTRADGLQGRITKTRISDAVRESAIKAKVVTSAIEDILALAGGLFEIVEVDGKEKVLTRDGVGITPGIDADSYFGEVSPNKPHWFPGSQGAGSGGGKGGGGLNGDNPWGPVPLWNVTKQGQILREKGAEHAERLAKAAGSFVGSATPPKAKK